jgi:flagellar motor protein MotB
VTPLLALALAACLPPPADGVSAQLEAEVRAARQRIAAIEARGCDQPPEPHPVYAQLVQIFSSTEVEVARQGAGARLVIPADLLFPADGLTVRREAAMVVDLLGTALGLHRDLQVEVRGHADDADPDPLGRSLATARVLADTLVAAHRLEPGRFTVSGRGAGDPRSPGDHSLNRRIEVLLLPAYEAG